MSRTNEWPRFDATNRGLSAGFVRGGKENAGDNIYMGFARNLVNGWTNFFPFSLAERGRA